MNSNRFYLLDLLRFFFAFAVCVAHTKIAYSVHHDIAAYMSVDFFFILSGYVLTHQIKKTNIEYKAFVISRIARIFPLYLLSIIAIFVTLQVNPLSQEFIWTTVSESFLLHQIGFTGSPGLNGVSWSLSAEFWLNILVLYFIASCTVKNKALYHAILFSALLVSFVMMERTGAAFGVATFDTNIQPVSIFTNIGLIRSFFGLTIGYLLYCTTDSNFVRNIKGMKVISSVFEIALTAIVFICIFFNGSTGFGFLSIIAFSMLIIFNYNGDGVLSKLSGYPVIRELGNLSYSIYLLHIPTRLFLNKYVFPYYDIINKWEVVVFVTVIISVPIYYAFEVPAKKITRKALSRIF